MKKAHAASQDLTKTAPRSDGASGRVRAKLSMLAAAACTLALSSASPASRASPVYCAVTGQALPVTYSVQYNAASQLAVCLLGRESSVCLRQWLCNCDCRSAALQQASKSIQHAWQHLCMCTLASSLSVATLHPGKILSEASVMPVSVPFAWHNPCNSDDNDGNMVLTVILILIVITLISIL